MKDLELGEPQVEVMVYPELGEELQEQIEDPWDPVGVVDQDQVNQGM